MSPSSNQAFKAIADPSRREILRLLRRGEMTAGNLAQHFDMTKPTMSHHFAVLKDADLLTSRRDGQTIWYGLNTTVVQDLMAWAMDLIKRDGDPKDGDQANGENPEVAAQTHGNSSSPSKAREKLS